VVHQVARHIHVYKMRNPRRLPRSQNLTFWHDFWFYMQSSARATCIIKNHFIMSKIGNVIQMQNLGSRAHKSGPPSCPPHPRLWDAKFLSLVTQSIFDIMTWFLILRVELSESYVCNQKSLYYVKNWRRYSSAKFGLSGAQKVAHQVACLPHPRLWDAKFPSLATQSILHQI